MKILCLEASRDCSRRIWNDLSDFVVVQCMTDGQYILRYDECHNDGMSDSYFSFPLVEEMPIVLRSTCVNSIIREMKKFIYDQSQVKVRTQVLGEDTATQTFDYFKGELLYVASLYNIHYSGHLDHVLHKELTSSSHSHCRMMMV